MYTWLLMTIISGILLGFYDIFKKKALERSSLLNVLFLYTFTGFILVSYDFKNAISMDRISYLFVLAKSLVIFFSWILGFIAIRGLPISIITPFGTLAPIFSILFGVLILNERLGLYQVLGIFIILISYYFLGKVGNKEISGLFKNKYLYLMVASMLLSASSAMIDKIALKRINVGQMQFWFNLFLAVLYFLTLVYQRTKNGEKISLKFDYFIVLMSIFLVVSDRIYFEAVKIPVSQISVIMPLRKISIFVSTIIGGFIFKEKNLKVKFGCISLLIVGIAIIFMS